MSEEEEQGVSVPEWAQNLPESMRNDESIIKHETADSFIENYANMRQHMGNSIRIPRDDATDEQKADFRSKALERLPDMMPVPVSDEDINAAMQKLGLPEEAAKYTIPELENDTRDEDQLASLKAAAFDLNMTQRQFSKFVKADHEQSLIANSEYEAKRQADQAELKAEWGSAYDERVEAGVKALERLGIAESIDIKSPAGMMAAYQIAQAVGGGGGGEGVQVGGQPLVNTNQAMTPTEAQAQLGDVLNALHDKTNGGPSKAKMAQLVSERDKLLRYAYPDDVE